MNHSLSNERYYVVQSQDPVSRRWTDIRDGRGASMGSATVVIARIVCRDLAEKTKRHTRIKGKRFGQVLREDRISRPSKREFVDFVEEGGTKS